MEASSSPEGRAWHHYHPTDARPSAPISAATRACAQEADAATTRDDWKYSYSGFPTETQRLADSNYFLL